MPGEPELKAIAETVQILRRMMSGERIKLRDLLTRDGPTRSTIRRRLRRLVDGIEHAHRSCAGRGCTEEYWWTWPSQEQSKPEQVWALAASRAMLHVFRDGEIGRVLSNLIEDHLSRLPDTVIAPGSVDHMFYASTRLVNPIGLDVDVVDRFAKAIASQQVVESQYTEFSGDHLDVRIQPWTLLFADEGVYLYGLCVDSPEPAHLQQRRIYNIARFSKPKLLEDRFAYPLVDEYDPSVEFKHCFGVFVAPEGSVPQRVVLRFVPGWSTYLQFHQLHPTQTGPPSTAADGHILVEMELNITYDLVRWVRGHGHDIEVVAPESLARWVASGVGGAGYRTFVRGEV